MIGPTVCGARPRKNRFHSPTFRWRTINLAVMVGLSSVNSKTSQDQMADEKETMAIVCQLILTEKKINISNVYLTLWCTMAVILSSVFWICLHVSVTSLSDWLHIVFNRLFNKNSCEFCPWISSKGWHSGNTNRMLEPPQLVFCCRGTRSTLIWCGIMAKIKTVAQLVVATSL